MSMESFLLRASLSSSLMRRTLLKGILIALPGVLGWLAGGLFFSPEELQKWGAALFLIGLGLVAAGLLPYRRLSRQQLHPDSLTSGDGAHLTYCSEGRPLLTLPPGSIAEVHYVDSPMRYGIALRLNPDTLKNWDEALAQAPGCGHLETNFHGHMEPSPDVESRELPTQPKTDSSTRLGRHSPLPQPLRLYGGSKKAAFLRREGRRLGFDLFLPHFSRQASRELKEFLAEDPNSTLQNFEQEFLDHAVAYAKSIRRRS